VPSVGPQQWQVDSERVAGILGASTRSESPLAPQGLQVRRAHGNPWRLALAFYAKIE
jgi:hypothetical protein